MAGFATAPPHLPEPQQYQSLTMDRYITGLVTQRSLLRDADVPYFYRRAYGGRYDSIADGLNCELNAKLTLERRPGHLVYNSQAFGAINRFFSFRYQQDGQTFLKVLADCNDAVYDATGPATKQILWTKAAGATKTYFLSVGNILYSTDGKTQRKLVQPSKTWQVSTQYNYGDVVLGGGKLQQSVSPLTMQIVSVAVKSGNAVFQVSNPPANLRALVGVNLHFSGLSVMTNLNNTTYAIASVPNASTFTIALGAQDFPQEPETGTADTGNGISFNAPIVWATTPGALTVDGGVQWICKGNPASQWGIVPPTIPPTVTQSPLPALYPGWAKNTYFSTCFLIRNSNGVIFQVTTFGTTGQTEPNWVEAKGSTTQDNTVQWTSQGSGARTASGNYNVGDYIAQADQAGKLHFYKCVTAGQTAANAPPFMAALGTLTQDGTAVWQNIGIDQHWPDITASSILGTFGAIPLATGGTVIIGMGTDKPNGSAIALPTGYKIANSHTWTSPSVGFSGSSAVATGVYQSSSFGGVVNSSFQNESGGFAFNASSNWITVAWTDGADVTTTNVSGFDYIEFTTQQGDTLSIGIGQLANQATVPMLAAYNPVNCVFIAGMSSCDPVNHIMQGVQTCSLDATLKLTTQYNDNSGNTWHGSANIFAMFFKPGVNAHLETVTGGVALVFPTVSGSGLAISMAQALATGASFGLPSNFGSSALGSTCAMAGWTASGGNHGHGYSATVSNVTGTFFYRDGSGNQWNGAGNCLAIGSLLSQSPISKNQLIEDTPGYLQRIIQSGLSGKAEPDWIEDPGTVTQDSNAYWQNAGPWSIAGTEPWTWAYSWKNSVTNTVSTASPLSQAITINAGNQVVVSGPGSPDPQVDTIVIWRTTQGGGKLLYLDEFPAPPNGAPWTYQDNHPDDDLNALIAAPIAHVNDPPPTGLGPLAYHMSRIWGAVGSKLYWVLGPDATAGQGNEAWSPSNVIDTQNQIARMEPVTLNNGALLVFNAADVIAVWGTGTADNPFFPTRYAKGIGLLSYDALDVIGATFHLFTNARKQVSLDPSAGYTETGFPIGDQFKRVTTGHINQALYDPAKTFVSWHEQESGDTALFVADGSVGWFRYSPVAAPESGFTWSPRAQIEGGTSAVSSTEIAVGVKALLVGPKTNGPILMRDYSARSDNGVVYTDTYCTMGNIQLAENKELAEVAAIVLNSMKVGTAPTCGILLDEIHETATTKFDMMARTSFDPPNLPESETLFDECFTIMQNGVCPLCQTMQLKIQWSPEDQPSELLQHTIYMAKHAERVQV